MGQHLRGQLEHHRRLRPPPAKEARRALRHDDDRDRPRRRLPAAGGHHGVSRIPIRLRVAAAFAIAMTIVLAGSGWYVYASLGRHLSHALNRDLRVRADDLAAVVSDPDGSLAAATNGPFTERGESYAQLVARDGAVIQWTRPVGPAPVLSPGDVRRALQGSIFGDRQRVRGLDEPSRFLAVPVTRGGGTPYVLVVGATLKNRAETLHS